MLAAATVATLTGSAPANTISALDATTASVATTATTG
jgi:hypothetical protein